MSLQVRFWGVRGSIPAPGAATVRHGGNTSCLEVRTPEGGLVVLDAGTGIRELGLALLAQGGGAPIRGDLFLTHTHWDHIQGIPFFAPLFETGNQFTIWGPASLETTLERVLHDQMSPVVFPVSFSELASTLEIRGIVGGGVATRAGYEVAALAVRHPGGALGYRLHPTGAPARSLVYVSDNELGAAAGYGDAAEWRRAFLAFAGGASVLVHDAMYSTEEYDRHRGWGHSTYEEVTALAIEAGVGTLVLFHHEPRRTDDELDRCVAACRAQVASRGGGMAVLAASEGLTITT